MKKKTDITTLCYKNAIILPQKRQKKKNLRQRKITKEKLPERQQLLIAQIGSSNHSLNIFELSYTHSQCGAHWENLKRKIPSNAKRLLYQSIFQGVTQPHVYPKYCTHILNTHLHLYTTRNQVNVYVRVLIKQEKHFCCRQTVSIFHQFSLSILFTYMFPFFLSQYITRKT